MKIISLVIQELGYSLSAEFYNLSEINNEKELQKTN